MDLDPQKPSLRYRIGKHWYYNKDRYITGGICLGVGAAAACLIKKQKANVEIESNASFLTAIASSYKPVVNNTDNSTTIINEAPVTRLSYIVKMGTKMWETQKECAEELGVSEVVLSQFLNGKRDHVGKDLPEPLVRLGVRSES